MELGKLKKIEARHIWKNEAYNFTPWLAENISELNEALGIDLEVENTEVSAGPYSADILAKDTGTDRYVVIENQIEKTNHDHLGKCITYASVLNASTIIWVASDFTQEHKKALDWLNDSTGDEVSFYGVQVEVWKIDNSNEAVRFNIICRPNEAARMANRRIKGDDNLSEMRKFQYEFWCRFREKLSHTSQIHSLQSPRPQYWYDMGIGKSGIHISNTCNTWDKVVGIRIYIHNKYVEEYLPYLKSKKEDIESLIGQKLEWDPTPEKKDRIIRLTHPIDISDNDSIEEALNWLVKYTISFKDVFSKQIKFSGNSK